MSKIEVVEWQPREVKSVSAGKCIGRKECMRLGVVPYWIVTMGNIYLIVGDAEQRNFWQWMKARRIPVNMTQWDLHLVWKAIYPEEMR